MVRDLAALGRRHTGYGVQNRHYELVGEALLWALEHALGQDWDVALQDAWGEVYLLAASIMRRAGQRASGSYAAMPGPPVT